MGDCDLYDDGGNQGHIRSTTERLEKQILRVAQDDHGGGLLKVTMVVLCSPRRFHRG